MTKTKQNRVERKEIKRLHIIVTEADIAEGAPRRACLCPVALATKRALRKRDFPFAYVGTSYASISILCDRPERDIYFNLPPSARHFIRQFDSEMLDRANSLMVGPISFYATRSEKRGK